MKDFDQKKTKLQHCLKFTPAPLTARLVFDVGQPEVKSEGPKSGREIIDLNTFENKVDFQADRKKTLESLAKGDKPLAQNFEEALKETLDKAGYDKNIDEFWKEMEKDYKSKKVEVKDGKIHFYNEQGVEVAPKFSVIPIIIDLSKFRPEAPRSKYYDPDTGLVSLKDWKETQQITVANIIKNARYGTEITVSTGKNKPVRTARFNEDGKTANYIDGSKERVKIYDGYIVKLAGAPRSSEIREEEVWGTYPMVGEFRFGKTFSADDYISAALTGNPKIEELDETNANLKKIRDMAKDGYKIEDYTKFLTAKKAIKRDRIYLLVDTDFISEKTKADEQKREIEAATLRSQERARETAADRRRFLLPNNLIEKRKFVLSDPKLIEAVGNPTKWNAAWASGNIEGLRVLKGIIMSEPDIFGPFAKNPDGLRDRIREAIASGSDKQIDFEDLIDTILKGVRMPSFAEKADKKVTDVLAAQEKFSKWFDRQDASQKSLDQVKKAWGFLKKLGSEVYDTATVSKVEGKEAVWINLIFEGHAYTVRVREGGAVGGRETVEIYHFNTTTPYPKGNGYDHGGRFKVSTLAEGDFGPNNSVIKQFRDSVTPEMTYSRYLELFRANFNADGTPKTRMPAHFAERMQNIIIGGNRFLLQLRDMQFVETATGEIGTGSFVENRTAVIPDKKFIDTINNKTAWEREWANPTMDITRNLKAVIASDPVLSEIASQYPAEIAKRLHEAVNAGNTKQLDFGDVVEYVLKGLRMPSFAPEARELPKGEKFSEYYNKIKDPSRRQTWALLFLQSLGGESINRAVLVSDQNNQTVVETTYNNRTYRLKFLASAVAADVQIFTPDGKKYPDTNGYDQSESFWGNLTPSRSDEFRNWFEKATRPPLDGLGNFKAEYARLFDAQGNPKPGVPPEVAERYKSIIRAANKLLITFEGKRESIAESSESTYFSQILRNAQVPTETINTEAAYNVDELVKAARGNQILQMAPQKEFGRGVGLQMLDNILGDTFTTKVLQNKMHLFKAVFQTYTLEQLLAENCIVKGQSPKMPGQEFYVIKKLPDSLKSYLTTTESGQPSNFERLVANQFNLDKPEYREALNPQNKLKRFAEFFFPLRTSERTYEDVSEAKGKSREDERIYNRLDYTFAHTQFLKSVTEDGSMNGKIDSAKLTYMLNSYLELFDARLDMQYGPEQAPKVRKEFQEVFGGTLPKIDLAFLERAMANPKQRDTLAKAIREGFVFSHDKKVEEQREKALDNLKKNYEQWKARLTPEELKTLEEALKKNGVPGPEIPVAIEKILPVWFGLGIDLDKGVFGLGVGIGMPIKLGENGKYGTLVIGGGVALGATTEGRVGAGVGAGAAYKTPHLGPFALFAGGAIGAGIDSSGTIGIGGGLGAGVSIEWGTVGATKISTDIGVAYVPGAPFPLPGATITFEKNHDASIKNLKEEAYKKFGILEIDKEVEKATTPEAKKEAIGKNTFFRGAIERAHKKAFNQIPAETVIAEYNKYKANLEETIRQNYDPTLFGPFSRVMIGFGLNPDTGKFIFLVGASIATGREVKTVAYEGKGSDVMQQEIMLEHMRSLAERRNRGLELSPGERSEVELLQQSGKLLAVPGSNDLAVLIPKANPAAPVETRAPENLTQLQNRFNEILKPLNLRVEYDAAKKLFEIKFNDWNSDTNYDIAVDSKMSNGGIIFDKGHIYLGSNFDKAHPPTILRSDYEYPFRKEGKNYHTIITLSDSPQTPAHEIYRSAPQVLSSKGGDWYIQKGLAFDRYAAPQTSNIMTLAQAGNKYSIDAIKFEQTVGQRPTDTTETRAHIDKLSITEEEKGTVDQAKATEFAKKFLKTYPIDYRNRSNLETLAKKYGSLNDLISAEWKKAYNKEINPAELNLVRLKVMDESFSELGKIQNPAERLRKFRERLQFTETFIILPRFRKLIEQNNKKYSQGDSRRIRNSAEDLTRIVMTRVKSLDVNSDAGSVLLSQIDRTSTVAGTLGIFGFRGNVYGEDNQDGNQKMIGASTDYASFLNKPDSVEADIARLIFEETSTLPKHIDVKADTPAETLNLVKTEIYDLLRADLSQKVISTLFNPLSREMFSPGVREEIIRLAANKNQLSFNANSAKAIAELQTLVEEIRMAQTRGEKYYTLKNNPDFRFVLNYETKDGVYKKCTNYSMWINEGLELQMRTSKMPAVLDIRAGYAVSTATTVSSSQIEYTTINIAAAVAVRPKSEGKTIPPGETPKEDKPAAEGASGQGAGEKVEDTLPTKPDDSETITPPPTDQSDPTKYDSSSV